MSKPKNIRDFESNYPWAKDFTEGIIKNNFNAIDIINLLVSLSNHEKTTAEAKVFLSYSASIMFNFHLKNDELASKKSSSKMTFKLPRVLKNLLPGSSRKRGMIRGGGKIKVVRMVKGKSTIMNIDANKMNPGDIPVEEEMEESMEEITNTMNENLESSIMVVDKDVNKQIVSNNAYTKKQIDQQIEQQRILENELQIKMRQLQLLHLNAQLAKLQNNDDDDDDDYKTKQMKKQTDELRQATELLAARDVYDTMRTNYLSIPTYGSIFLRSIVYGFSARLLTHVIAALIYNMANKAATSTGDFILNMGSKAAESSEIIGQGAKVVGDLLSVADNAIGYVFYAYNSLFVDSHYDKSQEPMPTINSTSTGDIESDILYERKQSILQNVLEGVYNTLTSDKIDLNIAIIVFLISFAYLIHYEFKKLENKKLAIAFGNKSAAQIVAKNNSDEEQSMRLLNNAFTGGVQAASISGLAITGNLGLAGYMASNAAAQLLNAPAPQDTHDEYIKALTQGEQPSESKKHKGGKRSRRRYSVKNKYVGRRSRRRSVHKKQ